MRAILGVIAGIIAGFVSPAPAVGDTGFVTIDHTASVVIAIAIAIVFYIISVAVGKGIAKNIPKERRKKIAYDGIVPFIFMTLTFLIIVYTAIHQSIIIR